MAALQPKTSVPINTTLLRKLILYLSNAYDFIRRSYSVPIGLEENHAGKRDKIDGTPFRRRVLAGSIPLIGS